MNGDIQTDVLIKVAFCCSEELANQCQTRAWWLIQMRGYSLYTYYDCTNSLFATHLHCLVYVLLLLRLNVNRVTSHLLSIHTDVNYCRHCLSKFTQWSTRLRIFVTSSLKLTHLRPLSSTNLFRTNCDFRKCNSLNWNCKFPEGAAIKFAIPTVTWFRSKISSIISYFLNFVSLLHFSLILPVTIPFRATCGNHTASRPRCPISSQIVEPLIFLLPLALIDRSIYRWIDYYRSNIISSSLSSSTPEKHYQWMAT